VRISGSNAGYTMFRGSVKNTGYPLHSPVSPSLQISTGLYSTGQSGWGTKQAHTAEDNNAWSFTSTPPYVFTSCYLWRPLGFTMWLRRWS